MPKQIIAILLIFSTLISTAQECDIPNGGFELWNEDKPVDWGTSNVANDVNSANLQGFDMRTVFKSTDSKSGNYSLHLKNVSIVEFLKSKPEWSEIPAAYKKKIEDQIKANSVSASVYTCSGNCDKNLANQNTSNFENRISFPINKTPRSLCGYYKTNLKGGDKLWINPFLITSNDSGGGPKADDTQAVISENTSTWKKFKIPLYIPEHQTAISAGVQFYIVGSNFPKVPPYGLTGMSLAMSIPGNDGSEVWIDDVCFCDNLELDIWDAKLLEGKQIESGIKLSKGAQTVENIDNDDEDDLFDYNPKINKTDANVNDDDELVKIRLRIPYTDEENEEIILEITKGKENVQLWYYEDKRKRFKSQNTLFIPNDFDKKEGFWEKELWVEGIKAHEKQQGTIFKMYRAKDPETFDEVALTVIGIESIEWEGIGNSVNNDDKLDYDVNFRNISDPFVNNGANNSKNPCVCDIIPESNSSLKPSAVRVFPGKRIEALNRVESKPRDRVKAKITLSVKPIRPLYVYFDSFDVDDPTLRESLIENMDNEKNAEDNIGFVDANGKKSKSGIIVNERKDGVLKEEFIDKEQKIQFQISMQPGDNFRLVGAFDEKFIKALKNDDSKLQNINLNDADDNNNKQRITNKFVFEAFSDKPEEAEIRLPEKYASKVLTVWRFAYAEVDKMGPIGKDILFSKVVSYELNNPTAGQTKIFIEDNIIKKLKNDGITEATMGPTHTHVGMKDAFKEGEFRLAGQSFMILENSANEAGYIFNGAADYVVIDGLLPELETSYEEKICGLKFDDESKWGFKTGDPMPDLNPDLCVLERIFRKTYLQIDFETMNTSSINPNQETQFKRNTNADDFTAIKANYKFDNISLANNKDFWCFYINTCYAGATAEDGDPDDNNIPGSWENAITGIADDEKLGINIFMEGLLEFNKLSWTHRNKYLCTRNGVGSGKGDVIAHEIAHLFGAIHEIDKGIMNITSNSFNTITISRIRKAKHP